MSQPCHVEVWEKTSSRRQPDPTGRMRTTTIESVPPGMRVFRLSQRRLARVWLNTWICGVTDGCRSARVAHS